MKREFVFEIKEIKQRDNHEIFDGREDYVHITTGYASFDGKDIEVVVDDPKQKDGMFVVKDSFFKKLIAKIHNAVK